jgi:threonine dehydrogenase-like Zn-dependent dehydrogenase
MESRAFWIEQPLRGALRRTRLPPLHAGQLRIRALYSGISRGTETLVFRGEVPAAEYSRMRAPFQAGDFPGPVKYGYMMVGEVVAGSEARLGQTVFCLHPHEEYFDIPEEAAFEVPQTVPAARAVLAANMETAINGCWDAGILPGDRVMIIGAGVIGLLTGWLCARVPGTEVIIVDLDAAKEGIAHLLGLKFSTDAETCAPVDTIIHASGSPAGLRSALAVARDGGTIIEMSWYGTREVALPLGAAFHSRRLTLRSSQVGQIPPGRLPHWTHGRRLELALRLLDDQRLDHLINAEADFEQLPKVLTELAGKPSDILCQRIRYSNTNHVNAH